MEDDSHDRLSDELCQILLRFARTRIEPAIQAACIANTDPRPLVAELVDDVRAWLEMFAAGFERDCVDAGWPALVDRDEDVLVAAWLTFRDTR